MQAPRPRFHQLLREAREQARQSVEVMAILLNLGEDEYEAIERGEQAPDDETLRRLCTMLQWNYYDTQRMINNEMLTAPAAPAPDSAAAPADDGGALEALQAMPLEPPEARSAGRSFSLPERLREVREQTGQSPRIIAMLLSTDLDTYLELEAGAPPTDEMLRRISVVYDWNYYDLIALLRSQQASTLQPRRIGSPYYAGSPHLQRLKPVLAEVESLFARLSAADQEFVVAQLELIRDTMRTRQPAEAPAEPSR